MKKIIRISAICVILLATFAVPLVHGATDNDSPHNAYSGSTILCGSCHWIYSSGTPPWGTVAVNPLAPADEQIDNRRCLICHDGSKSSLQPMNVHSATQTGSKYWLSNNGWSVECSTCHDPHSQGQVAMWGADAYTVTGGVPTLSPWDTFTNTTKVTLPASLPTSYYGYYLMPNRDNPYHFKIAWSTANDPAIIVKGNAWTSYVQSNGYAILYEKLITGLLIYNNPVGQQTWTNPKLFNPWGTYGPAQSSTATTSICYICHRRTTHWSTIGDKTHQNNRDCIFCHQHQVGFKATCGTCHGIPPGVDNGSLIVQSATYQWVSSDSPGVGAHKAHYETGLVCLNCHTGGMMSGPDAGDNKINIGFNLGGSNITGSYDGKTGRTVYPYWSTLSTTTVTTGGSLSCSNLYCHSNVQGSGGVGNPSSYSTPVWTNPITGQCGTCHKGDGSSGTNSLMDSGSHTKHVTINTGYSFACSTCHYGAGSGSSNHANKSIDVAMDPSKSVAAGGSYNGSSSSPSNNAPGLGYGTCSAVYCHSNGRGTYTAPAWGSSGSGSCGTCHGATAAAPPASARHNKHVWNSGSGSSGYKFSCSKCHDSVVTATADSTTLPSIKNYTLHVNKTFNVNFDSYNTIGNYTWASGGSSTCSAIYCHSDGQSVATGAAPSGSAMWSSTLQCNGCHGKGTSDGRPMYANWSSKANSHISSANHASQPCYVCHNSTTSDGTSISSFGRHVNKTYDVTPGGSVAFTYSFSASGGSCTNISCHNGGVGVWGSSGSVSCGTCHAVNNTLAGKHSKHWAQTTNSSGWATNNLSAASAYMFGCGICHMTPPSTHKGGWVTAGQRTAEVNFSGYAGGSYTGGALSMMDNTFKYTNGTCASVYCHSNGNGGTAKVTNFDWTTSNGAFGCSFCHGGYSGMSTIMDTSQHPVHVGIYGFSCDKCHIGTTSDGTTIADKSLHVNKKKDVAFGAWVSFNGAATWNNSSCSNTYCHSKGNGTAGIVTPNWMTVSTGSCGSCHGVTAATPPASARHRKHTANSAGYKFACSKCHDSVVTAAADSTTAPSIKNYSLHVDKAYNVNFDTYNTIGNYGYVAGGNSTCAALYCHSDGQSVATGADPSGSASWNTTLRCNGCHGIGGSDGRPNYTSGKANSHMATTHSQQTCNVCHSSTTSNGTSISSFGRHVNKTYDVTAGGSATFTYSYNPGGGTCSTISCHAGTDGVWGSVGSVSLACGGCHSVSNTLAGQHSYHWATTGKSDGWYTGNLSTASTYMVACGVCHMTPPSQHQGGWVTTGQRTAEVNFSGYAGASGPYTGGAVSIADNTFKYTNGTCSVYCHSNGNGGSPKVTSFDWSTDNGSSGCSFCHGGYSGMSVVMDTSRHTMHVGTYGFSCDKCHVLTTTDGTTIADKSMHVNKNKDVAFGPWVSFNGTATWSNPTCSTTYCHSNGNGTAVAVPNWTSVATGACGTCHGVLAATPPASGAHNKHVGTSGYQFSCSKCHDSVVTATADSTIWASIKTPSLHVNKLKNIDFDFYNTIANYAGNTCSALYCHSDGQSIATGSAPNGTTTWTTSLACNGCHGAGTSDGRPSYSNGGNKANSHWSTMHSQQTCNICHGATTSNGSTITSKANHVNKSYDVWGTAISWYSFSTTGGTCSNTCHYSTTPKWGGASLDCNGCHSFPPSDTAHSYHIQNSSLLTQSYGLTEVKSDSGNYAFGCGNCHPTDPSKHADGLIEVDIKYAASSNLKSMNASWASYSVTPGTTKNGVCSGVYCHSSGSNGSSSAYASSPAWNISSWDATANKCGQCHGNPPQYASAGAGVPGANSHYNQTGFMGQEGGHMIGIHWDNVYKKSASGLATWGTTVDDSHGNSTVATTIACGLCHSGVVGSTVDTYAMSGTSSIFKCSSCHTGSLTPMQNGSIANKQLHINGTKDIIFANTTVNTKSQLRDASRPSVWSRSGTYGASGSYDYANLNGTWNTSTKTCTTACHNGKSATWGDTSVSCESCHDSL